MRFLDQFFKGVNYCVTETLSNYFGLIPEVIFEFTVNSSEGCLKKSILFAIRVIKSHVYFSIFHIVFQNFTTVTLVHSFQVIGNFVR